MSAWPGKTLIGLTGNIATGKSVIRKLLEHLGAYGIDADALGHRAIAKGAPGYQPVVETFGKWVLGADGQIDRLKLGKLVFSDPEALARLEAIIHPLVVGAVDILVRRAKQPVVVIEAIKLIESPLIERVDSLWVSYAAPEIQLTRLVHKRGMSEAAARQRIQAQPPQAEKVARAQVVIRNEGSFEDTWRQVSAAWYELFPEAKEKIAAARSTAAPRGTLTVQRAGPRQAGEIATLITRLSGNRRTATRDEIMAAFGEKAFLILYQDDIPAGLVGWKVENLVACTGDLYLDARLPAAQAVRALIEAVENTSRELQCEISLLFLERPYPGEVFQALGYAPRQAADLGVRAWQEAALESLPPGADLLFKQLRQDRVLRPV